jgi:hypothetical protein
MSSDLYRNSSDDTSEMVLHIKEFEPEMIFPSTNQTYEKDSWGTKMVVLGRPACFEKGTKILMYNGKIKSVQDVEIGDVVMGDDSTPRNVLSLSRGHALLYKIVPKIGEPIIVNGDHIITIVKTKGNNKGQIIDISVDEYLKMPLKIKTNYNWIRVPVEFPSIQQKIDPYVIGYFIDGDYSFIKREFIKKHFPHITDNVIDKLIEKNVPQIPNFILYSAVSDRAQYLAGMLDAKATYNATTKRFDIPLPSEELCEQVMYLAGSIGYYNSKIKNYKSNFFTQTQQVMWSCYIYVNTNTELPSKIFDINYIKTVFGGMFTTDFYITEHVPGDFYGFTVDGNHRFLLGDFSITHNSGKCMGENTPIMMYDGSIKMIQHVQLGDLLMGDDSTPRKVLELYSGIDDLYKVCQTKGDSYVVNSQHIMVIKDNGVIQDKVISQVDSSKHFGVKVKIQYDQQSTPLDPYDYGANVEGEIDKVYILNNFETRLQVLAGYLDVHGLYNDNMHTYQVKIPIDLYKTFILLVRTLGFHMTTNKHGLSTIYGRVETIPCKIHLPKKVNRRTDMLKSKIKIEYLHKGNYYGFELNGNGRYVLGDCTVTHNTYAIKSLLYQKRHIFPVGLVFSGSEDTSGQWKKIFPDSFVYNKLKLDKLRDFLERQKLARKHLTNPWSVLLLDDCGYDAKLLKNELFKEIFQNGRHYKMWFILALQYPTDIQPSLRACIDYVFIFKNNNHNERKKIYDNYASIIPSFSLFCAIMDEITNDYTALVINNLSTSNDLQDCIYWFKAPPFPPDFKFGSMDFWNHHYVRYNDD